MNRLLAIILFVLLLSPLFTTHVLANPSTVIYVSPDSKTVNVGDTFSVNVEVADVVGLTCWQFTLYFNKAVLQCTGATEGPFLKSGGGTIFGKTIDNTNGNVAPYCSLLGNTQVSGSGVLVIITFSATAAGQSTLHLADTLLGNTQIPPKDMPHSTSDGVVYVGGPPNRKLTVSSAHDSPSPPNGDNFYSDGQSMTCSVTSPVTEGNTVWTCTGWTGTGSVPPSGTGKTVTFLITQDSSITWNWQGTPVQHKLTVSCVHDTPVPGVGDHYYDHGQSVTCSVTSPVTEGNTVWTCTGWTGSGSVPSSGSGTLVTFTMTQDSTITWNWQGKVNQPPVASNLQINPPSPKKGDSLTASYTYYDADGDPESTSEIRWYKDTVLQSAYNDMKTVPGTATVRGQTWYFTVRPYDGKDFGDLKTSASVTVLNTPPAASGLTITPSSPKTMDDLVAGYAYYDADGDLESGNEIRWYKNGLLQSAYNDLKTVPASATVKGEVWYFTLKPKDGAEFGTLRTSSSVTIQNTPPAASNLAITPSFPLPTDNLVGSYDYYDADGDGQAGSQIRWYKNAVLQSAYNDLLTVPYSTTSPGQQWYFTVTPKDGTDSGTMQTSPTVTIQSGPNTPPVASNLAMTPSSPKTTDNLVGSYTYYDADGNPESGSEIRWYKNGALQSAYNDLLTVPSSGTSAGESWYFTVRPKDGKDFGVLQTSPSVTILVHVNDVAIMDIIPSKVYMYQGHSESFRILVQNKGMMTEIFNVTLRVNNTIINTQTVTLTGGDSTNITISWDTTGFNYGNYTVVAYAEPVQYETLTDDNACRSWIFITIPGDINHDFTVDIYDAILLAGAFNSRSSDSHWDADADINGDDLVDIYDAIMLAGHYGEKPA